VGLQEITESSCHLRYRIKLIYNGVRWGIVPSIRRRDEVDGRWKGKNASGSCWDDDGGDDDDDLTVGMDIGQMKTTKYETDVLLRGLVLVDKI